MINRSDVLQAGSRISGYVRRTPLLRGGTAEAPLWFKCEFLQHTGVFKARGAFNRQLAARERGELDPGLGVVVASGGNAGWRTPMPPRRSAFRPRCSFRRPRRA